MGSANILGPSSVLIVSAIIMSKKPPTNGLKSPTCTLYTPRTLYHFILITIQFNLYSHNFNFTFLSVSQTVLWRHPVAYQPLINSLKWPNCNVYVPRISYKSIVPCVFTAITIYRNKTWLWFMTPSCCLAKIQLKTFMCYLLCYIRAEPELCRPKNLLFTIQTVPLKLKHSKWLII